MKYETRLLIIHENEWIINGKFMNNIHGHGYSFGRTKCKTVTTLLKFVDLDSCLCNWLLLKRCFITNCGNFCFAMVWNWIDRLF